MINLRMWVAQSPSLARHKQASPNQGHQASENLKPYWQPHWLQTQHRPPCGWVHWHTCLHAPPVCQSGGPLCILVAVKRGLQVHQQHWSSWAFKADTCQHSTTTAAGRPWVYHKPTTSCNDAGAAMMWLALPPNAQCGSVSAFSQHNMQRA
jgi:hypothetical protein